jgi:putative endonuclease
MMETPLKKSYVYILCNRHKNVIYVGASDDLKKRIYLHRNRLLPGFTSKYNVVKFVYFEEFNSTNDSHSRENQIKKYRREKKIKLIEAMNPNWIDLYDTF